MEKERKIKLVIRCVAFLLLLCMALAKGGMETEAAGMSLADLQVKFPGGKYWNHATQSGHDYDEKTLVHSGNCNNPDGYTEHPCTGHTLDLQGEGYYDCNTYGGGLQCCGFAYKLADDAYGSMPNSWGTTSATNAKAGDVIHFNTGDAFGHWAMIIGRNGTTVTLGECNYDYHCRIDWGRTCNLSAQSCTIYSAPWELQTGSSTVVPEPKPEPVSEYEYREDAGGNGIIITKYQGNSNEVVIPSTIDGKKVTGIGEGVFAENYYLRSVILPEGVTSIGKNAFSKCSSLNGIVIRSGIIDMGVNATSYYQGLESVIIPNSVTSIGDGSFAGCSGFKSIEIPSKVTSIGEKAFWGCSNLESVTIPDSVASIGDEVFSYCGSLKSITIPEGVASIGEKAFSSCRTLESTVIPNSVTNIGAYAFYDCSNLESVNIPSGLTVIEEGTFENCSSLTGLIIPNGVKQIRRGAFAMCSGLTSLIIPETVESIGGNDRYWQGDDGYWEEHGAFGGCSGLTSLKISRGVKEIGTGAFAACSSLRSVAIPSSVTNIGAGAFSYCSNLESVDIPSSLAVIEGCTFEGCSSLTSLIIPNGVKKIKNGAFALCRSLTSLTIPETVESIGVDYDDFDGFGEYWDEWGTFAGCSGLTSLIIPESVESIGEYSFYNCSGLVRLTLPDGIKLGEGAFDGCRGLISLTIPDGAELHYGVFGGCSSLTSLTVSKNIEGLEEEIENFSVCGNLANIKVDSDNKEYDSRGNCNGIIRKKDNALILGGINTVIPDSTKDIDDCAFRGRSGLRSITIPGNVRYIGSQAFENCNSLKEVTILNGLGWRAIRDDAFANCGLSNITIHGDLRGIGTHALGYTWKQDDESDDGRRYEKIPGFLILGKSGSTTEKYAKENGFEFWPLAEEPENGGAGIGGMGPGNENPDKWKPDDKKNGGNGTDGQKLSVKVEKIKISGISKKIAAGKKITLKAAVSPANAADKSVTWKSGNAKYATVDNKGVVKLKKAGAGKTVTVTATAKDGSGKTASYKIRIMKGVVGKVTIAGKANRSAKAGTSIKLKTSVKASGKANKALRWKSSDTRYAAVDGRGKVTLKGAGKGKTVKITVMAMDGSGKKASVKIKIK